MKDMSRAEWRHNRDFTQQGDHNGYPGLTGKPQTEWQHSADGRGILQGAKKAGHHVEIVNVFEKRIGDCRACEYCHTKGGGKCVQDDDMQEICGILMNSDMLVLASPIYYHGISGQLKCAIDRFYSCAYPAKPPRLKMAAIMLSSGAPDVYEGALYSFQNDFVRYLGLRDMGVFTYSGKVRDSELYDIERFGAGLM